MVRNGISVIAGLMVMIGGTYAQEGTATPLLPAVYPHASVVSWFGAGGAWQQGAFLTACRCRFFDGVGSRWVGSVGYLQPLKDRIAVAAYIGVQRLSWWAAYREYEMIPYYNPVTGKEEVLSVLVRNDAKGSKLDLIARLTINGYLTRWLMIEVGAQLAKTIAHRRQHWQTLEQKVAYTAAGTEVIVQWAEGDSKFQMVEDGAFSGLRTFGGELVAAVGVEIPLTVQWYLRGAIQLEYTVLPLSAERLRFVVLDGLVGLRVVW